MLRLTFLSILLFCLGLPLATSAMMRPLPVFNSSWFTQLEIPPVRPEIESDDKQGIEFAHNLGLAVDITVRAGQDLQAAADSAVCGDSVVIDRGARFVTPGLEVPALIGKKNCTSNPITVTTTGTLPASFRFLSIAELTALNLPKIVSNTSTPAVEFVASSSGYRIVGIEVTNDDRGTGVVNNGLVFAGIRHGSSPHVTLQTVPKDIEFDRTWVHAKEDGTNSEITTCVRGFWLGANDFRVINSRVAGFSVFYPNSPPNVAGASSHAIFIEKGPGPYTLRGNFLNAWFASIFTGGGPQWITNESTVVNASLTRATLENVRGALPAVGDYVAFRVVGQGAKYHVAKVLEINGTTITYVGQPGLRNGDKPTLVTGNPLTAVPEMPGHVVWNGDRPTGLNVTNNTFWKNPVVGAKAALSPRCGLNPNGTPEGCYGKGHIEFKTVLDGLVEGNDFSGFAAGFTITSRNQSDEFTSGNNPWATITNLTFRNNRWRGDVRPGTGAVIGIQLNDNNATTVQGRNVTFENNLFENLGGPLLSIGGSPDVTFKNNTALGGSPTGELAMIGGHSAANENFKLENNLLQTNEYMITCSISPCFPGLVVSNNVILDNRTPSRKEFGGPLIVHYPGNAFPQTFAEIQLGSDWKLAATSPYKAGNPGVDTDRLLAALGGAIIPTPTPSPTPTPAPSPGSFSITGSVVFSVGEPAAFTMLELRDSNDRVVEQQASAAGRFEFVVPAGTYNLRLIQFGYNANPSGFLIQNITRSVMLPLTTIGPAEWFPAGQVITVNGSGGPLPSPTPSPAATPSPTPTPTPSPSPTPTPTPEPNPSPVPVMYEFKQWPWPEPEDADKFFARIGKEGWGHCFAKDYTLICSRLKLP